MPNRVDGQRLAMDMALKVLALLLHRRGALDLVEFAEELEVRALLLSKTDGRCEVAPAASAAAAALDELAQGLREIAPRPCGARDVGAEGADAREAGGWR